MSYRGLFAKARSTTLNEDLGQIQYIFSDKTGTLTQNIMTFNKASIGGQSYGDLFDTQGNIVAPDDGRTPIDFVSDNSLADPDFRFYDESLLRRARAGDADVDNFFRLLALCHTVMPEEKSDGRLVYQAQSPDEGALVSAARNFGFVFTARTPDSIAINVGEETILYDLLAILDFNNERKRMSVIVRDRRADRIQLLCKGADSVIFARL